MPDKEYLKIHAKNSKMRQGVITCLDKYIRRQTVNDDDRCITGCELAGETKEQLFKEVSRVFDVLLVVVKEHFENEHDLTSEVKHIYLRGECIFHLERKYLGDEPGYIECADKYGNTIDGFCSSWSRD